MDRNAKSTIKDGFKAASCHFLFFLKKFMIFLVKTYQLILSPLLSYNKCRFEPSCSAYMIEALEKKGLIKGLTLGTCRILKCHPFSKKSGFDPVK
jgi:uncharacterized protein